MHLCVCVYICYVLTLSISDSQFPEGGPISHWLLCKTGLVEGGRWYCYGAYPTGVELWGPPQRKAMRPDFSQAVLVRIDPWGPIVADSLKGPDWWTGQLEEGGRSALIKEVSTDTPRRTYVHSLPPPSFTFIIGTHHGLCLGPSSTPSTSHSGTSGLLLRGFRSGIRDNEDSKFTSLPGNAHWETQQMGSNCRPVVGTLLTNTQVAVYRAFWNRMWLGSWGRLSNYQHLSFLFNEGECGNRPGSRQPGQGRMPGRASMTVPARPLPWQPGASMSHGDLSAPFSQGPRQHFWEWGWEYLRSSGILSHRPLENSAGPLYSLGFSS